MNQNKTKLRRGSDAVDALKILYESYGYSQYKMSKFEEYELYVRNKSFLVSDHIISFTDIGGSLMALKPDVTLSIVKNSPEREDGLRKVYYNENVYRVSQRTNQFKEIMQAGLECIGDIDMYDIFESVYLAAKSLDTVSPDFVLDISHMGIISAVLDGASDNREFKKEAVKLIAQRNIHDTVSLCKEYGIPPPTHYKKNS